MSRQKGRSGMISDKERCEIVAWLRDAARRGNGERVTDGELVDVIAHAIGVEGAEGFDDRLLERLADLIDRPTCKNADSHYDVFECSLCHCKVELITEVCNEYGESFHVPFLPLYCPSCSAEVMG